MFAAARRGLLPELSLITAAAAVVFRLIGWTLLPARREADRQSARARQRGELSHALGVASFAAEVSNGLAEALRTAFPDALSVVALEAEDRLRLELAAVQGSSLSEHVVPDLVTAHVTTVAYEMGVAFALPTEDHLRQQYPEVYAACGGAVRLQRSLLAQDLPALEGVELVGRYQAGGAGLEVGGDWYDVIRRSDGIVHITVGDVAGRGVVAAVLMGQMRHAFRAYAFDHTSPAELLRRMLRHVSGDELVTAVCLMLDPYTQELTYASAGHPPSLLRDGASGAITRLDRACAPPLGFAPSDSIREADLALPPGSTLVAYTDGLIERRGWSIDVGSDLLASVLASSSGLGAECPTAKIVDEVAAAVDSGDDIALLVVRLVGVPARMDVEIPSDPATLAGLRRRLRTWLELRGLSEEEREDAVLSVSEACNNAIEHGYRGQAGVIRLALEHRADTLEIVIEDRGTWREPSPTPERGRGIQIMRAVMHDAKIEHATHGTRVTLTRRLEV